VLIGTFQGASVVVAELPAGVLADTVSRRLALVVAHVASGSGMAMAAFVTDFPLLVVANCLWGIGWAFASGADVAWITDELDDGARIDRVLAAQGRWDLLGNPVGVACFGALAWALSLARTTRLLRPVSGSPMSSSARHRELTKSCPTSFATAVSSSNASCPASVVLR
jgi:MFS transporter, DHA3 family, tetracycline resistance protein